MARLASMMVALFPLLLPAVATEPGAWGPTVAGLKMSGAIAGTGGDLELQITVKNIGERPLLLPFGHLIGPGFYDFRFQVFVRTPGDFIDQPAIYTAPPFRAGTAKSLRTLCDCRSDPAQAPPGQLIMAAHAGNFFRLYQV